MSARYHAAMLLTITTTHRPATDLGFLLHKHPARVQTFTLTFGKVHVFYPEASEKRCTAALLLDVDPVGLVRGRGRGRGRGGGLLDEYVNDRPYVASSFLSVAMSRVLGSALGGRSATRPELVDKPLPLIATVAALPCRGDGAVVRRLFEPLDYTVSVDGDDGSSPYRNLRLEGHKPLAELLVHLYVLIPVLDDGKHYWVGDDEVDKLVDRGAGWLAAHPEREFIARRYLKHRSSLAREALARLSDGEAQAGDGDVSAEPEDAAESEGGENALERPVRLNEARMAAVTRVLREAGAARVLDLGCGQGRLLRELLLIAQFTRIVGLDASVVALEIAARRLKLQRLPERQRQRVELLHGALTYRDRRLSGYDAAAAVEVVEHLDASRLAAFERVLFEFAQPATVVVTTPNREYNANFPDLPVGKFRHADHRFEWTRDEFAAWAGRVAAEHGYTVDFQPVGEVDPELGPPTQMGVFRRCG